MQSRKQIRSKIKRKRKMEFSGGWEARGSVFVLAQVSLFIEVILLWRCKTFLQVRQQKGNDGIKVLKQTEL